MGRPKKGGMSKSIRSSSIDSSFLRISPFYVRLQRCSGRCFVRAAMPLHVFLHRCALRAPFYEDVVPGTSNFRIPFVYIYYFTCRNFLFGRLACFCAALSYEYRAQYHTRIILEVLEKYRLECCTYQIRKKFGQSDQRSEMVTDDCF